MLTEKGTRVICSGVGPSYSLSFTIVTLKQN